LLLPHCCCLCLRRLVYANGDRYEGGFSGDHKHGRGRYQWASGDVYEGMFHRDRRCDVRGKMTLVGGSCVEGIFVNDQLV